MREILFRAWSEKEKCYRHNVGIYNGHAVRYGYQWYSLDNDVFDSNPEQFTGLTDKNGQKIFEGDILKITWSNKHCKEGVMKTSVVFWQGNFCHSGSMKPIWPHIVNNHYEVIGNIRDNPDLIAND